MFSFLDSLGLPLKYAILCALGTLIGYFIWSSLGYSITGGWPGAVLAGAVGGFVGGMIRKARNRSD